MPRLKTASAGPPAHSESSGQGPRPSSRSNTTLLNMVLKCSARIELIRYPSTATGPRYTFDPMPAHSTSMPSLVSPPALLDTPLPRSTTNAALSLPRAFTPCSSLNHPSHDYYYPLTALSVPAYTSITSCRCRPPPPPSPRSRTRCNSSSPLSRISNRILHGGAAARCRRYTPHFIVPPRPYLSPLLRCLRLSSHYVKRQA